MSKPRYRWWGYDKSMLRAYPEEVNEYERIAIETALSETKKMIDGAHRVKVIELVFFKDTHTLQGAALNIPCDYETAKRWQQQFIRLVAKSFGCQGLY